MSKRTSSEEELKKAIWRFWEENPCGTAPHELIHPTFRDVIVGTAEFYKKMDELRYSEHPHLQSAFEFGLHKGEQVLEVGCGLGADLCQFVRNSAVVTGVDIADVAIETTRNRLKMLRLEANLLQCDATKLPFSDGSFDMVYCNGVLHHLPDTKNGISEIYRVLRPGKTAIVMLYNLHSLHFYWWTLVIQGILRLGIVRYRGDFSKLISNSTDGYGNPLSKLYSHKDIRVMFHMFSDVTIQTYHIPHSLLFPKVGKYVPRDALPRWLQSLLDKLGNRIGFHNIIKATK